LGALLDYLRSLSTVPGEQANDAVLLDRFIAERDDAAFAQLYQRHGPLVWGVCRRVLGQGADAEDAFQATFLVLLRKAHAIGKRTSVRSWLYGVAYRVAARARAQRMRPPPTVVAAAAPDPGRSAQARELRAVLDDEVSRLPERLRLAIVCCYFEGRTHDDAARLLGCSRGTIASHVARARHRLRDRLARRGLTLGAGALGMALAQEAERAAAAMPAIMLANTAVSARVAALAKGATRAMFMSKLITTSVCLVGLLLLAGILTAAALATPGDPTAQNKVQPQPERQAAAQAPAPDPLDAARKASIAAADLRSATGTAVFEQYVQEQGAKEPTLTTRAKVKVFFDQGKYLLRFTYETKRENTTYETRDGKVTKAKLVEWKPREFVILYDGKDAYSITFADAIRPAGCMMEIYPAMPVPEFPWKDVARLGLQMLDVDGVLKNLGRDAVTMAKLPAGVFRGTFHYKGAPVQCTFDVAAAADFNVTAVNVTNQGDATVVQKRTATWKKVAGRWYALELVDQFDNRHLSATGSLTRSVLRYDTFEPGATIDPKQFTLAALPIPERVYRLDRRPPP
jgi:RNA polymerase sigma factor (sigma-70 family)